MDIIKVDYKWNGALVKRNETKYIILHHRAGNGDVESIHAQHLSLGWTGIGYHFYVRKNGTVYRGRPLGVVGAHCQGHNSYSVGVCFEGNFEKEKMPEKQIRAGVMLVSYLRTLFPSAEMKRHGDMDSTLCPGKNFKFEEIVKGDKNMTVEEAVEIIQAKAGLEDETIEFLLCYKYGEELVLKIADAMV